MIHQIEVYKPSERMPELRELVYTNVGLASWYRESWWKSGDAVSGVEWWHQLTDPDEIASKLSHPEPVKPEDDPFRIRTHREMYQAAVRLRDELGLTGKLDAECYISEQNGESDVSFYLKFTQMTPLCRVSARATVRSDPQLVYDEFERLMRARFAPPQPVPAGLEACDGAKREEPTA